MTCAGAMQFRRDFLGSGAYKQIIAYCRILPTVLCLGGRVREPLRLTGSTLLTPRVYHETTPPATNHRNLRAVVAQLEQGDKAAGGCGAAASHGAASRHVSGLR